MSKFDQEIILKKGTKRSYRFVTLSNGIKTLLISDSVAGRANAFFFVGSGSARDPPNKYGLSHFLEHVLFLGNKKYPKEDQFRQFVRTNGGSTNAHTELDLTYYHFEINQEKLLNGLDQFASFFTL